MEKTQNVILMSEVLGEGELARTVAEELAGGLRQFFGVEGQVSVLGKTEGRLSIEVHSSFF